MPPAASAQPAAPPKGRMVDVPKLTLLAQIEPSTIDLQARTVDLVLYTGAPIARYDWMTGQPYMLTMSLDKDAVRLGRLNDGAPLLANHDQYDLDAVLGVIQPGSAKLSDRGLVATVRFATDDEEADAVWNKVRQRVLSKISVGAWIYKFEQADASATRPMTRLATDWEPFEGSIVPVGADAGAKMLASASTVQTRPCLVITRATQESNMEPQTVDQTATPDPQNLGPQPNPGDPGAPSAPPPPAEPQTVAQGAMMEERNRADSIMRAVLAVGLPAPVAHDLIKRGTPLVEAQNLIIERVAARAQDGRGPGNVPSGAPASITRDFNEHVRAGITNALLHRVGPQYFKLDDGGRLYRGRTLLSLAECFLQSEGQRTTHLTRREIVEYALGFKVAAAGYHSTSDFPNILADVANKTLRAAYEEAPQTFRAIIRTAELPDFKPVKRNQLSEAPELEEVGQNGEITSGTMGDAKEQYQLATFARKFGISRQALINDDTDAFGRLAIQFGRMARHKESDLVWAQITSNPVMGDGETLFSVAHANISGGAGAISVTTIGAGRTKMRAQRGLAGVEHLNIAPMFLIVPTALETLADQFVSTALLASEPGNVNPFSGKLGVIAEPRLDTASASVWYLAASPAQLDMIELAFLAGETGPSIESRVGWDVQGLEVKVVHDVAARVIDHRGFYKNSA